LGGCWEKVDDPARPKARPGFIGSAVAAFAFLRIVVFGRSAGGREGSGLGSEVALGEGVNERWQRVLEGSGRGGLVGPDHQVDQPGAFGEMERDAAEAVVAQDEAELRLVWGAFELGGVDLGGGGARRSGRRWGRSGPLGRRVGLRKDPRGNRGCRLGVLNLELRRLVAAAVGIRLGVRA
jgi:hypothetical protein